MVQAVQTPLTDYVLSGLGPFSTVWTYADAGDVTAALVDDDGLETALTQGADYTLSGATPLINGGQVLLSAGVYGATPVWPAGTVLRLRRQTSDAQSAAFGDLQGFTPRTYERMFDRVYRRFQELKLGMTGTSSDLARAVFAPVGEPGQLLPPLVSRKGKLLSFDLITGKLIATAPAGLGLAALNDLTNVDDADLLDRGGEAGLVRLDSLREYSLGLGLADAGLANVPAANFKSHFLAAYSTDYANVKDYGAVGDDATNDSAAVAAALATGKTLWLPEGCKCRVDAGVVILADGQGIVGARQSTTGFSQRAGLTNNLITPGNDSFIKNCTIDGKDIINTALGNALIGSAGDRVTLQRVIVKGGDRHHIVANAADDWVIEDCFITAKQIIGVWLSAFSAGTGGTNGINYSATITGGSAFKVATALYDVVGGSVTNIRWTETGQYSPFGGAPTISFPAVANATGTLTRGGSLSYAILAFNGTGKRWSIRNNLIVNGGIFGDFFGTKIERNDISGVIYGAPISTSSNTATGNNVIAWNFIHDWGVVTLTGGLAGPDTDNSLVPGIESFGSGDRILHNMIINGPSAGISNAGIGVQIEGNHCINNGAWLKSVGAGVTGYLGLYFAAGILLGNESVTADSSNCMVRGNRCYDVGGNQEFGIYVRNNGGGSVANLCLDVNNFLGNHTKAYNITNLASIASFRGRRLYGKATWNPAALTPGGVVTTDVTVQGADGGGWKFDAFFDQLSTESIRIAASYLSANQVRVNMYSMGATVDFPSGNVHVLGEELL